MHAGYRETLKNKIFNISSVNEFEEIALELFMYQSSANKVYKKYLDLLGTHLSGISHINDIPCLPVSLFKTQKIVTGVETSKLVFKSSGTGGITPAKHYVADPGLYKTSFLKGFKLFYGDPAEFCIIALLPSYIERGDSSLVYMASELIKMTSHPDSGFYLEDLDKLAGLLVALESKNEKVLLLGVSFALIDLAEKYRLSLKDTIVMETGGMKGKRKEITREELHSVLKSRFGVREIHSEYGMTELLSQAYSQNEGQFSSPPWMKVMIRDPYNPFVYLNPGRSGGVNIIDLANIDSCAFLETADLGRIIPTGQFEILGRFDNSDIRGCNLLADN